jgi:amino acid transporter
MTSCFERASSLGDDARNPKKAITISIMAAVFLTAAKERKANAEAKAIVAGLTPAKVKGCIES